MNKALLLLISLNVHFFFSTVSFAEEANIIPIYTIEILSPSSEETFQNSTQSITVQISVNPELAPEDKVVIYVDGHVATEPMHSTSIALPWLARGSHTIQAKIIQSKGNGAESDIITIYQQRVSRLLAPH